MQSSPSKHEVLMTRWKDNPDEVRGRFVRIGIYDWSKEILTLEKTQNNINYYTMIDMFGEDLGVELWENFITDSSRNLASWLVGLKNILSVEKLKSVRLALSDRKIFDTSESVIAIDSANNNLSEEHLIDIFGECLGEHLWDKLNRQHGGNVLSFLSRLTSEYRFSLIISLKTSCFLKNVRRI